MLARYITAVVIGFFSYLPGQSTANSGPPIPPPQISLSAAIEAAENVFLDTNNHASDFIVQSVQYTKNDEGNWIWRVGFIHPVRNDRRLVFDVDHQGNASLVEETE